MALTGLQIQKLLPNKADCKECGSSTCMAFAMKLAAKKASLDQCPYASDEAKQVLGAASEPPVKEVKIGEVAVGAETVFYRHEKTFVNQPLYVINLDDDTAKIEDAIKIKDYVCIRVGEEVKIDAICITQKGDADAFAGCCEAVYKQTGLSLILRGKDIASLDKASQAVAGSKSLICGVTAENADAMREIAVRDGQNLCITAPDVDGIFELTTKLKADGFNNLVVEYQTDSLAEAYQTNSLTRKAALKNNVKPVGYASLKFINTGNNCDDLVLAVQETCRYGGIIILPTLDGAQLVTLMTLRQNIYTDPQKPIQVEPKLYAIGEPDRNSEVFLTTNFSLTYFLVSGEIEGSGIDAWLVIPECEGMSVLTAWSAGKFSGAHIAKFMKEIDIESQVDTRRITIPGWVSMISGEIEEEMPGWTAMVGPPECGDIESYVKKVLLPSRNA